MEKFPSLKYSGPLPTELCLDIANSHEEFGATSKLNLLAGPQEETSQEVPKGWGDPLCVAQLEDFSTSIPHSVQKARHVLGREFFILQAIVISYQIKAVAYTIVCPSESLVTRRHF
ncbi:hypothetical protein E2320_012553 [Naja naja]|nr:hypothetical protein E2320_012553 [Naja naja]